MKFTEFRSKSLKALWKALWDDSESGQRYVCNQPAFSTWRVDDICANQWKGNDSDISGCVQELTHYIQTEVLFQKEGE
jgi:hypothetical protein